MVLVLCISMSLNDEHSSKTENLGREVNESFLVQFIIITLPLEYGSTHINFDTMKDKWNVNEVQCMLIQKETSLKKRENHSINLLGQRTAGKKPEKKNGNSKQRPHKINVTSVQIHKEEQEEVECRFCRKPGYYKKDRQKRKG